MTLKSLLKAVETVSVCSGIGFSALMAVCLLGVLIFKVEALWVGVFLSAFLSVCGFVITSGANVVLRMLR